MGPTLIFDKSFLESLNPDESVWLDQFYLTNITPLFFVETLADLDKKARAGKTPEDIVGSLAYRTPDLNAKANVYHYSLLEGELSGQSEVDMEHGRPHIGGGRYVDLEGKTGAYFEASPEEEAMRRWQEHKFLELERGYAQQWRKSLTNIDLEEIYSHYKLRFVDHPKPKTIQEVKLMADNFIDNPNQELILRSGLGSIGAAPKFIEEIIKRWHATGQPSIKKFAPYLTHILIVDLVFMFGIGADLIGRGRPSHKIDVSYLYYLPFCKIFTSNDRLHKLLIPLFLQPTQTFIPGEELKNDLDRLDKHYSNLPPEDIAKGVFFYASTPPHDTTFLTTRLWDKYQASEWREIKGMAPRPNNPIQKGLMDNIRNLEKRAKIEGALQPSRPGESDQMVIKRMVSIKRGKWTRFPPEITNRRKNVNGEWENIPPNK
ncbi:MAG: hypothetical protein WCX97_04920 [Candidatus Magasanikbacteria bacterium]